MEPSRASPKRTETTRVSGGRNSASEMGFVSREYQSAVAVGARAHIGAQRNISLMAGIGYAGDDFTTNVGVGFSF